VSFQWSPSGSGNAFGVCDILRNRTHTVVSNGLPGDGRSIELDELDSSSIAEVKRCSKSVFDRPR